MKSINTSYPIIGYWDSRQGGRLENQDACGFLDTDKGLVLVVCDGMGGGPAGQLASTTAVKKIVEYIVNAPLDVPRTSLVGNAIEYAHRAIIAMGIENPTLRGMGSTATVVLIDKKSAILGHVGDSRIYQFRRRRKIFRTQDHSLVAELVRNKTLTEEQARLSSQSNIITKALGGKLNDIAEVTERPYEKGDRFMLCTDGVWGMMPEKELIHRMTKMSSLSGTVDSVVLEVDDIGKKQGSNHDNFTIALFETKNDSILKEKMSKHTLRILSILALLLLSSIVCNIILFNRYLNNPYEDKVIELSGIILEKDSIIRDLQKDVIQQKHEVADVTLRVAEEKEKAAEEAQKAAEKAKREAQEIKAQAEEAAKKQQVATNDNSTLRKEVVEKLKKARDHKEDATRKAYREEIVNCLKTLSTKDPSHKAIYEDIIKKINVPMAARTSDQAKGHYNTLIRNLEGIK